MPWEYLADVDDLFRVKLALFFLHHVSLGNCKPAEVIAASMSSA